MERKTSRTILYRPTDLPKAAPAAKPEPAKSAETTKPDAAAHEVPHSSAAIWEWLENNKKYIKVRAICEEVGVDAGNFSRLQKNRAEIPAAHIPKIVAILKTFGYGS